MDNKTAFVKQNWKSNQKILDIYTFDNVKQEVLGIYNQTITNSRFLADCRNLVYWSYIYAANGRSN